MKYKILIIFSLIFVLIAVSGVASASSVHTETPAVSVSGFPRTPTYLSYLYENQTSTINVNMNQTGYSNYSITAYFGADNDTGLSPLFYHTNSTSGVFSIPITAPSECEDIFGYINGYATNSTGGRVNYTYTMAPINVSKPVVFNATVENTDPVPIYNINLTYTIAHGKSSIVIGISHIAEINGNSTYKDNITVPAARVYKGKDTLTVTTNNPVIKLTGKSSVVFYNGEKPNYDWIYYIAAVAVALSIFLIVASGRRNTVRVPKWKRASKKTKKLKKTN
jgi:hypothetical protein